MRLKLTVIALYGLILLASLYSSASISAFSRPETQAAEQDPRLIFFDLRGTRGQVHFDHEKHEAALNQYPNFPHKERPGNACVVCHHKVENESGRVDAKDLFDVKQYKFQKCADCHKPEGNAANPVPNSVEWANQNAQIEGPNRNELELNSREAFHRLCISCHRVEREKQQNVAANKFIPVTCSECHKGQKGLDTTLAAQRLERLEAEDLSKRDAPDPFDEPVVAAAPPRPTEIFTTPVDPAPGYAGSSNISVAEQTSPDAVPVNDRWRIGFPEDPRTKEGQWYNPYNQNVLKGDYPIFKQHNFLVMTLESETFLVGRRIPVPSNQNSQRPDSAEFFGRGGQIFTRQNFTLSVELFHGDTSFKPIDWRFRFTPNFNINLLNTQENMLVNVNPAFGANRLDGYVGFQELFGEYRLGDTTKLLPFLRGKGSTNGDSPHFDSTFIRAGIQQFLSDFRGFIFSDFNLGVRLFGQHANNRYNFNAAYFYLLEKDTNSELNTRINLGEFRDQTVFIANLYRQDTKYKGYTTQFSFHYNNDKPSKHFDENDFLVRPSIIGDVRPHGIKSAYLGWTGDGHINRLNINHAFYQVFGHDTRNPLAGRKTDINAQMAALELSLDRDWLRFKGSLFWASGDGDPFDDKARGFDSIVDFTEFAGGKFSYWNSNPIPFTNTGVLLTTPDSLLPNLRSSKLEGQSNFVNPGVFIYNLGLEAEITPKLRGIFNTNYLHFHHTESLEELLFQPRIGRGIGFDYGLGVLYRPFLNENIIIAGGYTSLIPGSGFKDIFSSNCSGQGCGASAKTLYSAFVKLKFIY